MSRNLFTGNLTGPLTAFGEVLVGQLHPVFQYSFEYTVDNTHLTDNMVTNSGTVTQADGMAVITTGATTDSMAMLSSHQVARYRSGLGGKTRFTALFTTPVAATEQYVGLIDEMGSSAAFKNGYIFGYDGTTFGIHRFQNDVKTTVAQSNWNIDKMDGTGPSGMTLDQTKLNVFEIQFQYLGGGAISFFIEDSVTGLFVCVHQISYANQNTEPSTHNPNFKFHIHAHNKATTSSLIVKSSSFNYFIEGKTSLIEIHQPTFGTEIESQAGITSTELQVLTIKNKATYASKTNFISALVLGISAAVEANNANNLAKVLIRKNATIAGSPTYADINTTDSIMEVSTDGTTVSAGTIVYPVSLAGKNAQENKIVTALKVILNPGETLTISGTSANLAEIQGSVYWRELF